MYARDGTSGEKQRRAIEWMGYLSPRREGRLSMQVINEYYDVTTRKLRPNLPRDEARSDVRDLLAWNPLPLSADLTSLAWAIEDRFQLSYWDALIVGAAQTTRCDYLLTEDLQTDAEFDALRVIDPFVVEPGSV